MLQPEFLETWEFWEIYCHFANLVSGVESPIGWEGKLLYNTERCSSLTSDYFPSLDCWQPLYLSSSQNT